MAAAGIDTLFHFSFAVNDLDRARTFYGGLLGCPEGRKLPGRADFNFFGHHIVAHLSPDDVVGDKGAKLTAGGGTPMRHFGVVMPLEKFQETAKRLSDAGVEFIIKPQTRQPGTVREQMLMTCRDGCGNAVEFKGLRDVPTCTRETRRRSPLRGPRSHRSAVAPVHSDESAKQRRNAS
jgi:extradiol dioxygenase family protein